MCKEKLSQDTMFALKDGKVIHISEVPVEEKGLNCICSCIKCGQPLIARLGEKNEHHFAHHVKTNCVGSLETAMHLFAKEVLERYKKLVLPKLSVKYYITNRKVQFLKEGLMGHSSQVKESIFTEECEAIFDNVHTEYAVGDVIADAVLFKGNTPLLVEIKVTHEVDNIKLEKVKAINISTIEIDLSERFQNYYEFNRVAVEDAIINDTSIKHWAFNVAYEESKQKLKEQIEKQLAEKLRKEKEEEERLQRYRLQKHEDKVNSIRFLLNPEYQDALKTKWDMELDQDDIWIKESNYLGITKDTIPDFLNKKIEGEIVFNCDRRIWQMKLFNIFIYKWAQKRQVIGRISIKYLVDWVKKKSGLPLNEALFYTKDVQAEFPGLPSLSDVLFQFMMNLSEYGFVKPTDRSRWLNGDVYYWWFDKLEEDFNNSRNDDGIAI